jgi:hypothetical protein
MGECQGRFRLHDHRLRCDPAGPKHWDLPWCHGDCVTEVRPLYIANAKERRVAHVDRSAVHGWEATGDLHSSYNLLRGQRPHTDDHGTVKDAGGFAWPVGNEHRYIDIQFDVPYSDPGLHEGVFKGKTTPQQKTDEIVPPTGHEIIDLIDKLTLTIHAVARQVSTNVGAWRKLPWFWITGVEHFQERTRFGVALAKEQKIIGQVSRHHG